MHTTTPDPSGRPSEAAGNRRKDSVFPWASLASIQLNLWVPKTYATR